MGIDEANLKHTISRYNHAKEIGYDADFHTNPDYIKPVREESGHIYCFRIFAGGYDTMGGIAIDENANILDEDNLPIQGLYGAGDMAVGSLYGDPSNAGGNVHGSMPVSYTHLDVYKRQHHDIHPHVFQAHPVPG